MNMKVTQKKSDNGKNKRLVLNLRKKVEPEIDENVRKEFSGSFDSIGSNIKIFEGSFSGLKPLAEPSSFSGVQETGKKFTECKSTTSTLLNEYELISDPENSNPIEQEEMEQEKELSGETTQEETEIEKKSCENFLIDMTQFIARTQNIVEEKKKKRVKLIGKVEKLQNKVKNLQETIQMLDRFIAFGGNLPQLLEHF